jgi:NAD(P)H-flavin reductase
VVLNLRIREVLPATPRARIVRIELDRGEFDYEAGQAVLVAAAGAARRPYSIAASPQDTRRNGYIELLVGVGANGAPGPHLTLEPGSEVEVEGPLGSFTFPSDPTERRFVFIAGGTGIAPLRAMLRQALTMRGHRIGLLYSARTPEEFAYEAEFRTLAEQGRIELRQTVTRAFEGDWSGTRGRISRAELQALIHHPETLCFICGPPALVGEMSSQLSALGVARPLIRAEEWLRVEP